MVSVDGVRMQLPPVTQNLVVTFDIDYHTGVQFPVTLTVKIGSDYR
jgi:hypothetical protein